MDGDRARHLQDGDAGEQRAYEYLCARGLAPVARNFRCREGELDLVMRDASTLVVVEVRYRRSQRYGGAAASVDARKQRKIVRATRRFLAGGDIADTTAVRFDVVALSGETDKIDWIRNAFDAG